MRNPDPFCAPFPSPPLRRIVPHPPGEFLRILERERSLSDRTGVRFSMVRFRVGRDNGDPASRKRLAEFLLRRARGSDEVGWTEADEPAVLLAGTPAEGACAFAEKVCRDLPPDLRPLYTIHSYPVPNGYGGSSPGDDPQLPLPFDGTPPPPGREGLPPEQRRERAVERIEPLLVRPLPSWKRAIDIAGAVAGLILCAPLFLLLAIYIKSVSPGPVLFRQWRVGHLGKLFPMVKFRTMHPGTDEQVHQEHLRALIHSDTVAEKLDGRRDPRIIPLGLLIRQLGLDEIPQLFNVLAGDMSLVGPRPCLPYEAIEYQAWAARRFDAVPGMTGLWQVSGKNQTTYREMLRLDIRYLQRISFLSDLRILARTGPVLLQLAAKHIPPRRQTGPPAPPGAIR